MSEVKTTSCGDCQRDIKYTTRKPKTCTACRAKKKAVPSAKKTPAKKTGYKKKPDNKNTNGELVLFRALDKLLKGHLFINHGYYSNIPSPKGYAMQLDRFYPDLNLAFEFDGRQHAEFSKYIHKTQKNFDYYKECDKLKEAHCKELGITLIRVAWNYRIAPEALEKDILKANPQMHKKLFGGGK